MKHKKYYLIALILLIALSSLYVYKLFFSKPEIKPKIIEPKQEVLPAKIDPITKIDNLLTEEATKSRFSGAVIIAKDNKIELKKAYGYANLELNVKNEADTKFRIASLTKSFIAASILILEQEGKLKTTDNISEYLKTFKPINKVKNGKRLTNFNYNQITIHDLLSHQSGIPNYFTNESSANNRTTIDNIISEFLTKPLNFKPGFAYEYSNSNYVLLTKIIEEKSGTPINEFLSDKIFNPLDMQNTGFEDYKELTENKANGYEYDKENKSLKNADFIDLSNASGAGGLYSTIDDLLKWDQSLYSNKLLTSVSLEKLVTPNKGKYAYGWRISDSIILDKPHKLVWHYGFISGFAATIYRYTDDKITMIFLRNIEGSDFDVNNQIPTIYWGLDEIKPETEQINESESLETPNKTKSND